MKITEKYAVNLILSVILVFSLIGFTAAAVLNFYVTNEKAMINNVKENNVASEVYDEIETYFDHSRDYSNIPADVYMSALSVDDIEEIIEGKINSLFSNYKGILLEGSEEEGYDYHSSHFDYSALEKSVKDYFFDFAKKNNIEINDDYRAQRVNTVNTAIKEIENFCDVYMLKVIDGTGIMKKAFRYYDDLAPTMYVCGGIALLCILLLITISFKRSSFAAYWMSVSFIVSALIMLIPTLMVKLSHFENRLIVRNESIYVSITSFISKIVNGMIMIETAVVALGLLMLLVFVLKHRGAKKKERLRAQRDAQREAKRAQRAALSSDTGE